MAVPEITLSALARTRPFLPEDQQPIVDDAIEQVKEIATSILREHKELCDGVRKELGPVPLDRIVATLLGKSKRFPAVQRNFQELLNQTAYLAQALIQRANEPYQRIVLSFREYMDDLEKRFAHRSDTLAPFVALTSNPGADPLDERVQLVYFDATFSLFDWSVSSHAMSHRVLARTPGMQEEWMKALDLSSVFLSESFDRQLFPDIQRVLLENHIFSSQNTLLSDMIGLLHQGPTALLGLIRFLQESRPQGILRTATLSDNPQPIDPLRILFGKAIIEFLPIPEPNRELVFDKLDTLFTPSSILLRGDVEIEMNDCILTIVAQRAYSPAEIATAAHLLAQQFLFHPLKALGGKTLLEMFAWNQRDEIIREQIQKSWEQNRRSPYSSGSYSAHTVAAALHRVVIEGKEELRNRNLLFGELVKMARKNPHNLPSIRDRRPKDPSATDEQPEKHEAAHRSRTFSPQRNRSVRRGSPFHTL